MSRPLHPPFRPWWATLLPPVRRLLASASQRLDGALGREVSLGPFAAAGALGLAIRLRAIAGMPLPPPHLCPGLLLGLGEDLACAAALLLLAGLGRAAALFAGTAYLATVGALVAWGEALVYFGHPPTGADLEVATQATFWVRSFDARLLATPLLLAGAGAAAAYGLARVRRLRVARATLLGAGSGASLVAWLCGLAVPRLEAYRHPAATLAAFARSGSVSTDLAPAPAPPPALPPLAVRELMPGIPPSAFAAEQLPLTYTPPPRNTAPAPPAGVRPNLVVILMEGVRAREVGACGGTLPGLTPNLDRLAAEGVLVERAYSPGTHTSAGELAVWYGALPVPGEVLMRARPFLPLSGLPEALRAAGWRSFLWIHNSDWKIFREDQFFLPRGFRMIDEKGFSAADPGTNWGKSDKALMRRAVGALGRLEEPFAAMVLTITNHLPFQLPADARVRYPIPASVRAAIERQPGFGASQRLYLPAMLETVHYTDEAVGDFFAMARSRPWFGRTLFVIASDHGLALAPPEGVPDLAELAELRHRVPLVFLAPWLPPGLVVRGPASLADVPATALGLLGVASPRVGPGVDLLAPGAAEVDRPVIGWTEEARLVTVWSRTWKYLAAVEARAAGRFAAPADETLVWLGGEGAAPDAAARRAALDRHRRWAEVYLAVYPWLITSGRAVVPAAATPAPPTTAGTTR